MTSPAPSSRKSTTAPSPSATWPRSSGASSRCAVMPPSARLRRKPPTYGVIMSITKAPGFDTRALTEEINKALAELRAHLPERRRNHAAVPAEGLHRPRHRQSHRSHPRRRDHGDHRAVPLPAEFPHHLHHADGHAAVLRHHHARLQMVRHQRELDDPRRPRRGHRHGRG